MEKILLIVDPQNDFITGSLAVKGAKEKMMKLAEYIEDEGCKYDCICITLDSHPENHISFKENGGIWPKHCVINTNGWGIPEYLEDAMQFVECGKEIYFGYYHKGTESDKEEYSIFDNSEDGFTLYTQIKELMRQEDVWIDVCGIAGDYCVLETIKGLRNFMGDKYIKVLTEYTASIDGGVELINYLKENNISYE
jgi:nicotinamidase/pyrazinamidase